MEELSKEVKEEIKQLLPELRKQVLKEFKKLGIAPTRYFHSDKAVLNALPGAAYEFIILCWGVDPERIDNKNLYKAINTKLVAYMPKIVAHTLRRMCKK